MLGRGSGVLARVAGCVRCYWWVAQCARVAWIARTCVKCSCTQQNTRPRPHPGNLRRSLPSWAQWVGSQGYFPASSNDGLVRLARNAPTFLGGDRRERESQRSLAAWSTPWTPSFSEQQLVCSVGGGRPIGCLQARSFRGADGRGLSLRGRVANVTRSRQRWRPRADNARGIFDEGRAASSSKETGSRSLRPTRKTQPRFAISNADNVRSVSA